MYFSKQNKSNYKLQKPIFLSIIRSIEGQLFRQNLKLKGKTLDFGCGDGYFAKQYFTSKIDVGLDVDPTIKKLAQNSRSYNQVIIFDGEKIPYPSNYFSTVVSNCVLEHIPNLDQNLSEIARVLKSGGKFYTTVMEEKWNNYLLGKEIAGTLYVKWMQHKQVHHNLLSLEKWKKKFKKNHLTVLHSEVYLTRRLCRLIDLFHYLGVGDLVSYKLTGKWVIFPSLRKLFPLSKLISWGQKDTKHSGGAIFFICQKSS